MAVDVHIFEVALRDGLQNEPVSLSTAGKLAVARALDAAGVADLEVTSFVRPDRVPQLADADAVVEGTQRLTARSWVLVPNAVGMEKAVAAGARRVCTVVSASETHNLKNINRSVRDSLAELRKVIGLAVDEGIAVRAYVSTVFGCPYEGRVPVERTLDLACRLLDLGAQRIVLGDTIGTGTPDQVAEVIAELGEVGIGPERLALHAHDTFGTALVNVYAAWRAGVTHFDASLGGIGGCPYAPGASGNLATEDLVHLFEGMGVSTGVSLDGLLEAGRLLGDLLGRPLPGRVHRALIGCGCVAPRRASIGG